jgi:hypothetical protein
MVVGAAQLVQVRMRDVHQVLKFYVLRSGSGSNVPVEVLSVTCCQMHCATSKCYELPAALATCAIPCTQLMAKLYAEQRTSPSALLVRVDKACE